ncbi:MAG: hypothetical protein ACLT9P_10355 [Evtepia gabavorous]
MVGWILLLVVLALVLLACVLRLGVAAGYEEGGGWVKGHPLAPNGSRFTQSPRRGPPGAEKNSGGRKQRPEATRGSGRTGKNSPWGGRLTWRWNCCPGSRRRRANSAGRCGWTSSVCG